MNPELLAPGDPRSPKYWMYEQSGALKRVVEKYLEDKALSPEEIRIMRLYLCQWIDSPVWLGGHDNESIEALRRAAKLIQTSKDINRWLDRALDAGIDPL